MGNIIIYKSMQYDSYSDVSSVNTLQATQFQNIKNAQQPMSVTEMYKNLNGGSDEFGING